MNQGRAATAYRPAPSAAIRSHCRSSISRAAYAANSSSRKLNQASFSASQAQRPRSKTCCPANGVAAADHSLTKPATSSTDSDRSVATRYSFSSNPSRLARAVTNALRSVTSKNAEIDIVVIAACGERAGEVVETLRDFPELIDPRTGRSLMERTIIICNTSAMPVAAREASVYTGATLAEYYRQMGLNVLLLADSTSRWAQAMREISGRLEEIPGEEAFPAYLESRIAAFYERAGALELPDGRFGSLTIGGTVSPAGGNFEEPVTQGTLKVVGAFLGLSRARSDARRYPSIDPLDSWSKYTGIIAPAKVVRMRRLLARGNEVRQMMTVVGEEGTSAEDFTVALKADFFDNCYLQQNAYDDVDGATTAERQQFVFDKVLEVVELDLELTDKNEVRKAIVRATDLFRNWNYAAGGSEEYDRWLGEIDRFIAAKGRE